MSQHGGDEPIHGGDDDQRQKVAKAAQEAYWDVTTGRMGEGEMVAHILAAYDEGAKSE